MEGKHPTMLDTAQDTEKEDTTSSGIVPEADALSDQCVICYATPGSSGADALGHCDACKSGFHAQCLKLWLDGLGVTAKSFGRLRGPCPLCGAIVTVMAK